jgi:hypothetical protein
VPRRPRPRPTLGFVALFDGTPASFAQWRVAGPGQFALADGVIVTGSRTLDDIGLLYYAPQRFGDFVLRLQFRITQPDDNSGVFVRFRDPTQPLPDALLAAGAFPNRDSYLNGSWIAVDTGFEAQIDEAAAGDPPGQDRHRTGAIYDIPIGTGAGEQVYQRGPALQPGTWHNYEITVMGDTYTVRLDGQQTSQFTNRDPLRGRAPSQDPASGYIGLQSHPFLNGHVDFRNIRIRDLWPAVMPAA